MKNNLQWWVALNLIPSIGPIKAGALLDHFRLDPSEIFRAGLDELARVPGLRAPDCRAIREFDPRAAEREIALAEKHGVAITTRADPGYPELLGHIPDPPPILYLYGSFAQRDRRSVGIVGTRHCSPYGLVQAQRFAGELAEAGFTIVSGLARGIDTAAHRGALRARGRTIAVLGSGLLSVYPPENRALAEEIARSGLVLSELPLNQRPDRGTFPRRNRIISGLSAALLVIEAGQRSGALITAGHALEQGRDVFTLPGPVDQETSAGTNNLLREGALAALCPGDIADALAPTLPFTGEDHAPPARTAATENRPEATLGDDEASNVMAFLEPGRPATAAEISAALNLPPDKTGAILSRLEIQGRIRRKTGGFFVPTRDAAQG